MINVLPGDVGALRYVATGKIWVGCGLEGAQSRANDKGSGTETPERAVQAGGPHAQGADAVQDQTEDEDALVAEMAKHIVCVSQGRQRIGTRVPSMRRS